MPPSHTSARGTRRETIEVRRARGEASCAECRRHKQKCDKAIPCSTCVRRGCQAVCPNGTQETGPSTRLSKAESEELRHKLLEMSKRIRQLEDALQISHHTDSTTEPHPLLVGDLLDIKSAVIPRRREEEKEEEKGDDVRYEELLDSFGTLSVSERGGESYSCGFEVMLSGHLESQELFDPTSTSSPSSSPLQESLPQPIAYLSNTFPFTPLNLPTHELLALIESKLPSYERASALVEAYLEHLSWFFRPVDREQIVEEIIPAVYHKPKRAQAPAPASSGSASSPGSSTETSSSDPLTDQDPHTLALLFSVFAYGAVADLTSVPWNTEALVYHHLARTALGLKPVFEGASLQSVQAVALIAAYGLFSMRKGTLDGAWKMLSFATSLAASIGLHRDPSHFKLSPRLVQRRRQVFWELYTVDTWKGLGSGRPKTFTESVVDCEFPEDCDATLSEDGEVIPSFWRMRYMFVRDIVSDVSTTLGSVKAVKYSEILRLDKKVREFGPPRLFSLAVETHRLKGFDSAIRTVINQVQMGILKDNVLLFIHRNCFARCLIEAPTNPSRSRFAQSFETTYNSACTVLRVMREQFDASAHFLARIWPIWSQALTAGLLLGAVAACGKASALSLMAKEEFELALAMFVKMQMHPVVKGGLPILFQLRDQARQAHSLPAHRPSTLSTLSRDQEEEETKRAGFLRDLGERIEKGFEFGFESVPQREANMAPRKLLVTPQSNTPNSASTDSLFSRTGLTSCSSHGHQPQVDVLHARQTSNGNNLYPLSSERDNSMDVTLDLLQQYGIPSTSTTSHTQAPTTHPDRPQPQLGAMGFDALNFTSMMNPELPLLPTDAQVWGAYKWSESPAGTTLTEPGQSSRSDKAGPSSSSFIPPVPNRDNHTQGPQKGVQAQVPLDSFADMDSWLGLVPPSSDNAEFNVNFNMDSSIDGKNIPDLSPEDLATLQALLKDADSFRTDGSSDGMAHI